MLTIKQMEAIYWVDKLGSFELAGEKLCMSQAAISKRVQEVELAFNLQIFDRTRRSARLTDRGREVLARSSEILRLHMALEEFMLADRPISRRLLIGVTELIALTWLPAFMAASKAKYQHVTLVPRVDSSVNLKKQLAGAEIDLIIVPGVATPKSTNGIVQKDVGRSEQVWMVSSDIHAQDGLVPLADFQDMVVLTLNEESYIGDLVLQWMAGHGVVPREHLSSNSNSALSGMAMAGLGIANLPVYFLSLTERSKLMAVRSDPPLPSISYSAMYRVDGPVDLCRNIASIASACCDFSFSRNSIKSAA
jgi:DNA-binding transcriptional LysR family regulator